MGFIAPTRPASSEVVCTHGLTGKWVFGLPGSPVTCGPSLWRAVASLGPWLGTPECTRKGRLLFPPWPAMLKATCVFKFSSCNSSEQGQHCPGVLLNLWLVCFCLSLWKCVIWGRGLICPVTPGRAAEGRKSELANGAPASAAGLSLLGQMTANKQSPQVIWALGFAGKPSCQAAFCFPGELLPPFLLQPVEEVELEADWLSTPTSLLLNPIFFSPA